MHTKSWFWMDANFNRVSKFFRNKDKALANEIDDCTLREKSFYVRAKKVLPNGQTVALCN